MGQVCLISGPPGCGKTTWALQRLQQHQGPCAYLRLEGEKAAGLEQGDDSGIDLTWLCLLYTSPSPRDKRQSRMPSSA